MSGELRLKLDIKLTLIRLGSQGHVETVRMLVQMGANLNVRARNDYTALHWAACKGKAQMVRGVSLSGFRLL